MGPSLVVPVGLPVEGKVSRVDVPRIGYRWNGCVEVEFEHGGKALLVMTGSIAQWLNRGDKVRVLFKSEPRTVRGELVSLHDEYELDRLWGSEWVRIWPPWSKTVRLPRRDPLRGKVVYEYRVVAREAVSERDYIDVVNLEQYHYASREEIVAVWRCPVCMRYFESNLQPTCPEHGVPARLQEIRGSLPSSRFLVLELVDRKPFEPRIVGYVRIDTPIPLMHRRREDNGNIVIEKMIRERVFPKDWFHPTYWPLAMSERRKLITRYRELARIYGSKRLARAIVGEEISFEALKRANTAAARIARVVVHPDYRGDGLGVLAVRMAVEWIAERRIPEMKRRKHIVETIAQMARYNPFFEKVGFKYLWETASGRPVLMYPLTDEARRRIEWFLRTDEEAKKHGGRLYRERYGRVEKLESPIVLNKVCKVYRSELDITRMPPDLQEVLRAFGVERRVVEKYVLKNVNISIEPGDIVVVVGASGAGKTTLLRIIAGKALGIERGEYKPTDGSVIAPGNTRAELMIPGDREPVFGEETLLEHVTKKISDAATAVEILNSVGLSDAVFYRARFKELSTGQKERAKLASLLASKPNLLLIDEFSAHLDALTAQRVARKLGSIARKAGITMIVSTNRPEIIKALGPNKIIYVGYGTAYIVQFEESEYSREES